MTPFLIHVGALLANPGSSRSHRIETPVDWAVELAAVKRDVDIAADLELASMSGGLLVRGAVDVQAVLTCSRCLTEITTPMHVEVAQLVEDGAGAEDDDHDDRYHTSGDELDLEPILRDEVLLAMPLRPRCEPECEGLVTDSESDLNTAAPGNAGRTDSPFSVLQDLFGPGD